MNKTKIFISHSHKDSVITRALVDFLEKIGINSEHIIASSAPKAQLHTGSPLYSELRTALSDKDVFVIFLLSDNFYSSTVCMNEMGAAWIMGAKFHFMVLPDFSFEKVEGVILEKGTVGISLSNFDDTTRERFKDLRDDLVGRFSIPTDDNVLELGLISFFAAVDEYKRERAGEVVISMNNVKGYCIGDNDNDGCRIWRRESSASKTTAILDFDQTTSTLCSVVYFIGQKNWSGFKKDGKLLCFEIYSDSETFQAEVELHFEGHNEFVPILITNDIQTYRIPLTQFGLFEDDWKLVKEVCFLFRKKHVDYRTTVCIENVRLDR